MVEVQVFFMRASNPATTAGLCASGHVVLTIIAECQKLDLSAVECTS